MWLRGVLFAFSLVIYQHMCSEWVKISKIECLIKYLICFATSRLNKIQHRSLKLDPYPNKVFSLFDWVLSRIPRLVSNHWNQGYCKPINWFLEQSVNWRILLFIIIGWISSNYTIIGSFLPRERRCSVPFETWYLLLDDKSVYIFSEIRSLYVTFFIFLTQELNANWNLVTAWTNKRTAGMDKW